MPAEIAFDLALEHGRCVGVRLPESGADVDALASEWLAPGERAFAESLSPLRRRSWVGGRAALRATLQRLGLVCPAVLADARGAPALPEGILGSISHKQRLAVALVAGGGPGEALGVDLEVDAPARVDIASRVLTLEEAEELAGLDAMARAREVILRFSAKESIYKALDPFVRRYVDFLEVSLRPRPDGSAEVVARLRQGEGPFMIEPRWRRLDGLVLTTARVTFPPP
ncbi:MAG: 4'-phosphopantetheinyl transferase superfamily protein [Myxococcales bacterium]|nr:4'-phosphopantetheinyl transferase superfamily protein [Myxococcales bacterium]